MKNIPKTDLIINRDGKFYCAECDSITFDNWYEIYMESGAVYCEICGIELTKNLKLNQTNRPQAPRGYQLITPLKPQIADQNNSQPQVNTQFTREALYSNNFKFSDLSDEMKEMKKEIKEAVDNAKEKWKKFWDKIGAKLKEIGEKIKKKFEDFGKNMDEKFKGIQEKMDKKSEEIKQKLEERNEKYKQRMTERNERFKQRMIERNERFRARSVSRPIPQTAKMDTPSEHTSTRAPTIPSAPAYYTVSSTPNEPLTTKLKSIQPIRSITNQKIRRPNFDAVTGKRIIYEDEIENVKESNEPIARFDSKTGLPIDGVMIPVENLKPKFDSKTGKPLEIHKEIKEQAKKELPEQVHIEITEEPSEEISEEISEKISDESIQEQSQKVFTILESDIRDRLMALDISDDEKDSIAQSLIYLNYDVRVKYIEEFENFTSISNEKTKNLIKKIKNLPIPEEQKDILVGQLDDLIDEKKEEFVSYLEEGMESDMIQIESDIKQFEKDIQELKSDEEVEFISKQNAEKNKKKRTLIPE